MRVAVLGSGAGSNLSALLAHTHAGHVAATVSLVVSDREGSGVLEVAADAGVPAIVALPAVAGEKRAAYDQRLLEVLQAEQPDLIVLAGFMRILTPRFVAAFEGRIINIHPALLPAFPGAHGIRDTIAAGAKIAGCTTHIVTSELDAGPSILQAALAVRPDDDVATLARRVLSLEHLLLPRTVDLWAKGQIEYIDGTVHVTGGKSWLHDRRIEPVAGALYSGGF